MGTAFGGAIAAVVSLQSAPPGATLEAVHAAAEAARGNAAETAPAAMPQPEATAEARPEVEAAPSEEAGEAAEPAPETPMVVVPAGSEFAKAKPDEDPATPATEAAAEATEAPEVSEPAAEGSPDLAEVSTAAQPESQTEAPAAPEAPVVSEETVASAAPAGDDASPAGVAATEPAGQLATENAGNALPQLPQSTEAAPTATEEPATAEPATAEPVAEPAVEVAAEAAPEPSPEAPAAEPVTEPETAPADAPAPAEAEPAGLAEQLASAGTAEPVLPGQRVGQLPTIGTQSEEAAEPEAPVTEEAPAGLPALVRYAAPFDMTGIGPTVSVVLLDVGEGRGGLDAATVEAISFPVTIALDPASSNARERAGDYRAKGFELAILASNGLQRGMTAKDVEVAVEALSTALPETVAMVPAPDALFQIDREVVKYLAEALKIDGRGLITYARGLNVAGQAAEGAGVPHASVDRVVDEYKEDAAAVRRLLDRAAFDAGQKGRAVVVAHAYPETLKALYDWVASGPKGVTLAPVSAGMIADRAGR